MLKSKNIQEDKWLGWHEQAKEELTCINNRWSDQIEYVTKDE
jgi:hypothetical protein